jgi:RNA recognition motif-containing protein
MSEEGAQEAINAMNGVMLLGRRIRCGQAQHKLVCAGAMNEFCLPVQCAVTQLIPFRLCFDAAFPIYRTWTLALLAQMRLTARIQPTATCMWAT